MTILAVDHISNAWIETNLVARVPLEVKKILDELEDGFLTEPARLRRAGRRIKALLGLDQSSAGK